MGSGLSEIVAAFSWNMMNLVSGPVFRTGIYLWSGPNAALDASSIMSEPVGPGRGGMGDAIVVAHEPDLGPSNLPQKCELGPRCGFGG